MKIENIPEMLQRQALWCVWKRGDRGKIPYNAVTGNKAKSNDPSTFSDFDTACRAYATGNYDGLGIGIFNGIGAIDIDHCITDGKFSDMASDIIEQMGSYTEISPSGNGIRIIFTVDKLSYDKELYYINNHKIGLEVYIAGVTSKFVTITGNKITDNSVIDGTLKLSAVLDKYMLKNGEQKMPPQKEFSAPASPKDFLQIGLEKDEKLKAYWNGARPHGNESEDDAGFMTKLLYWCNNDTDRAIQAFCDSPYASQKDEKHQTKIKRLDYLPNLAKSMKPSRTAAQDNEEWSKAHRQPAKREVSRGLNIISAADLQRANFPAAKYLVEDLLPAGVSILAAAPKSGKSWFGLLLGLKIAAGEMFLQHQTRQAGVLYLSLEDTRRRLQERMNKLLDNAPAPLWFYFSTETITLEDGLLELLDEHIRQHPETKLIIIDTFQKIRGQGLHGERWYDHDYREAGSVKAFADKRGVSVLFVHHTSKTKDKGDPFNEISGTNGISGTMDTMFVLQKKARPSKEAQLYVTGRDVEQDELVIRLNEATCRWELVGHADELAELERLENYQASPIVKTIRALLDESPEKRWKGFAKNLLKECERLFEMPIEKSPQQVSKELCLFKDLLLEQDGIIYTTSPNGNAGSFHHFCYDLKASSNDDGESVEF